MSYLYVMKISIFKMSIRSLWRDLRSGELALLLLTVVLAVSALSTVAFFSDRLKSGLNRDAQTLLGGDAVLVSDNPPSMQVLSRVNKLGLTAVQSLSFPTMASGTEANGAQTKLVSLKAVEASYPLKGLMEIRTITQGPVQKIKAGPNKGEVWVDSALLQVLNLRIGDSLLLGNASFKVQAEIIKEPDRGSGFTNFAPRVMMNADDLAATQLIQPASRMTYRLAVVGNPSAINNFEAFVNQNLKSSKAIEWKGVRLETLASGRPEMTQTLGRASNFLNLVALLAALLSAVALALAARNFAERNLDACALYRVLGLSQKQIAFMHAIEFVAVGLLGSLIGLVLAYAGHELLLYLLKDWLASELPTLTLKPVMNGILVGLSLVLAFGLAPVLQLSSVPAVRVLRRDVGPPKVSSLLTVIVGLGVLVGILLMTSDDLKLGFIVVGGFAVSVLVIALIAWGFIVLVKKLNQNSSGPSWWRWALRQLSSQPAFAVVQISSIAIGLMAVLLLIILRTDLVSSWRSASPANAPDRFVINVMPEQEKDFQAALQAAQIKNYDWFPMFRGRLVAINGVAVNPDNFKEDRAKRLLDREFNLSNSAIEPTHNQLVAGRWIAEESNAISIEEGIAKTLSVGLNDRLSFDIAGVVSEAKITSIRKVDWSSMRANFFVMYPKANMSDVPATYMGAFKAPLSQDFDRKLVAQYPNITLVNLKTTLDQVQAVLNQIILAVEMLFAFSLLSGIVVLVTTMIVNRDQRSRDYAIMRALGASQKLLQKVQLSELCLVGALAGLLATLLANGLAWALAYFVFEFAWSLSLTMLIIGPVAGAALAWLAGLFTIRKVITQPVMLTLYR
jgi:putative ABC transport system permease protein